MRPGSVVPGSSPNGPSQAHRQHFLKLGLPPSDGGHRRVIQIAGVVRGRRDWLARLLVLRLPGRARVGRGMVTPGPFGTKDLHFPNGPGIAPSQL
jgi:hypothetical protein